jgi:MFS family permease
MLQTTKQTKVFKWLFVSAFFNGLNIFAVQYINSSFLERYLNKTDVAFLFAVSSLLSLALLSISVIFLLKFGNYRTILTATILNLFAIIGLSVSTNPGLLFVFFVANSALVPLILFSFDVFLESYTKNEETTGSVRGFLLTTMTLSALLSPFISGMIAGKTSAYSKVYLLSAFYLLPVIFILITKFKNFTDSKYEFLSVKKIFLRFKNDKNFLNISVISFLLSFYFSWMVIYLPIFLHQDIGFSWPEIGTILFIMFLPYLIIELPAGIVADKWLGEKEMLMLGFMIASMSTFFLSLVVSTSLLVWGVALFATRTGTALIESMSETYFFKQIDGEDMSILKSFRMISPLAYIVGPFTAGLLVAVFDIYTLWQILSIIMLVGIFSTIQLTDTK